MLCGASLCKGKQKFVHGIWVIWPEWLPRKYLVKTLRNLQLWNQWTNFLEIWYAASGSCPSWFVQMMILGWPWPILWQGQILQNRLLYGKRKTVVYSEIIAACDPRVLKVKVNSRPWPKVVLLWKLKLVYFRKQGNENLWIWRWLRDQDGRQAHIW